MREECELWIMAMGASKDDAKKYVDFCRAKMTDEPCTERHHILMRSLFAEFTMSEWNIVRLTAADHIRAHSLLYQVTGHPMALVALAYCLNHMNFKEIKGRLAEGDFSDEDIEEFARLRAEWYASPESKKVSSDGGKVGGITDLADGTTRLDHLKRIGGLASHEDKVRAGGSGRGECKVRWRGKGTRPGVGEKIKEAFKKPGLLAARGKKISEANSTPEAKARSSAVSNRRWARPGERERMSAKISGENNGMKNPGATVKMIHNRNHRNKNKINLACPLCRPDFFDIWECQNKLQGAA